MSMVERSQKSDDSLPRIFVLMPFLEENEWLFSEVLAPTIRELGFDAVRADTSLDQQNILRDIVAGIMTSALVIADITDLNANVMYELGLAHGLQKPTIMLTQSVSSAPFDLRPYRMIPYSSHFRDANRLIAQLREIIAQAREGRVSFGNPINDFGAGISTTTTIAIVSHLDNSDSEDAPAGYLDFIEQVQVASATATQAAERIAQSTVDLGVDIESRGARLQAIEKNDPNGYKQVRGIVASASQVIGKWTSEVNDNAELLSRGLLDLESATEGLLQFMPAHDTNNQSTLQQLADSFQVLDSQLGASIEGLSGMRGSMQSLPGISRDFGRVIPPAIRALDRVLDSMLVARAFASTTVSTIEERLPNQEAA